MDTFRQALEICRGINKVQLGEIIDWLHILNMNDVSKLKKIEPEVYTIIESSIMSREFGSELRDYIYIYRLRKFYVERFGWGLPQSQYMPEIADSLKEFREGLSIGCGKNAFVEKALAWYGVRIHCTDLEHEGEGVVHMSHKEAVEKYSDKCDFVVFIWPSYDDPFAYESLCLAEEKGKPFEAILYIGEGEGGCTACDNFHAKISTDYKIVKMWDAKKWEGICDYVMLYKLKE